MGAAGATPGSPKEANHIRMKLESALITYVGSDLGCKAYLEGILGILGTNP